MKAITFCLLALGLSVSVSYGADTAEEMGPTHAAISYGAHARNVLDIWLAKGDGPRPLLVHIHGGGWTTGDKKVASKAVKVFLDKGISYASINYRLTPDNPLPAPVHDAARAIQFIRSKAREWNLDGKRIALTGGVRARVRRCGCCSMTILRIRMRQIRCYGNRRVCVLRR